MKFHCCRTHMHPPGRPVTKWPVLQPFPGCFYSLELNRLSNRWNQYRSSLTFCFSNKFLVSIVFDLTEISPFLHVYVLCESTCRVRRQDWFHCISKIYKYWVIELLMDFPRCSQEAFLKLILKAKFKFPLNIFKEVLAFNCVRSHWDQPIFA